MLKLMMFTLTLTNNQIKNTELHKKFIQFETGFKVVSHQLNHRSSSMEKQLRSSMFKEA